MSDDRISKIDVGAMLGVKVDVALMPDDASLSTPTIRRIAGWAATGHLDLQRDMIYGPDAWNPIVLPLPLTLAGHPGGRIGTIVTAVAEGPMLWIEADVDMLSPRYLGAKMILDGPNPCFSVSAVVGRQTGSSLCACDDNPEGPTCGCLPITQLSKLELVEVALTDKPANPRAYVLEMMLRGPSDQTSPTPGPDPGAEIREITDAVRGAFREDLGRVTAAMTKALTAWSATTEEE